MAIAVELADRVSPSKQSDARLTAQDQNILALAATGGTTPTVAKALGLSPETVRRSLASIIERVGARSKTEAVMIAVRHGLIDLPTDTGQAGMSTTVYRPSPVRPVMRLLRWGEDEQRSTREPLRIADMNGRESH